MTVPIVDQAYIKELESTAGFGVACNHTNLAIDKVAEAVLRLLDVLCRPGLEHGLNIAHLRLIVFTGDFPAQVRHWQTALGRPLGVTEGEVSAVGKALTWQDDRGNDHSVVVVLDQIGYGLCSRRPLAQRILSHELGHVHYAPVLRSALGIQPVPAATDWLETRRYLAHICLDEFLAESVAAQLMDDGAYDESLDALQILASQTLQRVRERVARYRHGSGLTDLWSYTTDQVSQYTAHVGRVAGLGPKHVGQFSKTLDEHVPGWGRHLTAASLALTKLLVLRGDELSDQHLAEVEKVIESIFTSVGVIPKSSDEGLSIDVPFWPGDLERANAHYLAGSRSGP